MSFCATELYPIVEIIDYPERFAPSADTTDAVRTRAQQIWTDRFRVIEGQITGNPHFVDTGFSATDLYITVFNRCSSAKSAC